MKQVAGAVVGALLETLLIPGLHLGKNPFRAPGCFYPGHVNGWQCVLLRACTRSAFDCFSIPMPISSALYQSSSLICTSFVLRRIVLWEALLTFAFVSPSATVCWAIVC